MAEYVLMIMPLRQMMAAWSAMAVLALSALGPGPALAWSDAALADLRRAAESAPDEGLPEPAAALGELARLQRAGDRAALNHAADMLFDDLAGDFARGAVAPASVDPDWSMPAPPAPDLASLHVELNAGAAPSALLAALAPQSADYAALRAALAQVRAEPAGAKDSQGWKRETRLLRLRANMERWRWLPRAWPRRRVDVLIPQFQVLYFDGAGAPAATHAAIVGRRQSQTPRFMAEISSVTLNPAWRPPASIVRELLPGLRRDSGKAAREGFEAIGPDGAVIPPAAVDWRAAPFPYVLRQRPGPYNPLGLIRFNLPNPHAVYLHDTANRSLFGAAARAFSHGCVRVERPLELAAAALGAPWSEAALQAEAAPGATKTLPLPAPIPVYFLYLTARGDSNGGIAYAKDVYALDARLNAALDGPPPIRLAARAAPDGCGAAF